MTSDGDQSNPAARLLAHFSERVVIQQVGQPHLLITDVLTQRQVLRDIDTPGVGQSQQSVMTSGHPVALRIPVGVAADVTSAEAGRRSPGAGQRCPGRAAGLAVVAMDVFRRRWVIRPHTGRAQRQNHQKVNSIRLHLVQRPRDARYSQDGL